tara:strand:- start:23 stop:181 length:159 start_codon:yes stop_codon:yes gene_type:complete
MKTIKVYIEGGVCTDVVIPKEFHNKLNYEVIDYDKIDAEEEERRKYENRRSI